jgi:hypothetical protein
MAAKQWIEGAIKYPGSFSAAAKKAGKSVAEYAQEKASAAGKLGRRARLAETLMGLNKGKK